MSWLEGRKKHLEWSIKFTYKAVASQMTMVVVNVVGIAWNVYWLRNGDSQKAWFGFGMGAFSSNLLWTLASAARFWSDLKDDKHELKYLNELELKEQCQDDIKMYKEGRARYEQLIQEYQEALIKLQATNGGESSPTGSSDIPVQRESVPNCS